MKIHIYKNAQQYGPYSVEEVQKWISSGQLRTTDLACYQGAENWVPLSSVPGINTGPDAFPPPPPFAVQGQAVVPPPHALPILACKVCGGGGAQLAADKDACSECNWLRPLAPGFNLDVSAFQWAQDGVAMSTLRSLTPLNSAARAVSDNVGRHWIETTLNGIRLSDNQFPAVYAQAVRAARLLGMNHMPDVYVSGEKMWDIVTYGSDKSAFIVIGTALLNNFQGPDMLFLLGREIGHCRAGHALWKTLIKFMLGDQGPRKGMMGGGILAMLSPTNLLEGALELPLLGWARQAEITADRAGLMAVGDEEVARRVLLSWSLKSVPLYRQINIAEWLEQMDDDDDQATKLSEIFSSSTPYITRRLRLMSQYIRSPELIHWRGIITQAVQSAVAGVRASASKVPDSSGQPGTVAPDGKKQPPLVISKEERAEGTGQQPVDSLRLVCSACQTGMRIPKAVLANKEAVSIRCPNVKCAKVITLKKQSKPTPPADTTAAVVTSPS